MPSIGDILVTSSKETFDEYDDDEWLFRYIAYYAVFGHSVGLFAQRGVSQTVMIGENEQPKE